MTASMKTLLLATFLAACSACQIKPPVDQDKYIVFGKSKDAVTLDPADTTDGESSAVVLNIFEPLLRFQREKTLVEPCLATSWRVSEDKLTWTFQLRKGVKFHDGTPLTAEAVKFNYDRQMDEKSPWRFKGKMEYWHLFFGAVEKIEAPAEDTLVFHLKQADATFMTNLALFNMGIASPAAIQKYGENIFKNPVGTGPYRFKKWVRNEKIMLTRNPDYWGEAPKIDLLIYKPVPDNAVRLLELENHSIDVLDGINPDDVPRIRKNPSLKLITQPGLNVGYLALNNAKKPFDNVKVRQAINYAINKPALVKAFFAEGTLGTVAVNPMPPTVWGYNSQIRDYDYNPEKAKKLLREAGYPEGFKAKLWTMPIARPYMPQPQRIAEAIQADLKTVGIETQIVSFEWGTYLDKLSNSEHDMALAGWIGDNGDPDNFLYTLLDKDNTVKGSAANYAFYQSQAVHELLVKARTVYDQSERTQLYEQAQVLIKQDAPWVPLFHSTQMMATLAGVEGFYLHPVGEKKFNSIYWTKGRNK
ncbi:ABC transporter substrate-binding protein [bacterium (Candidatus Blackallbacteria) CG17_big_fil_post_rev_8_21_14_2_50_48_46]|uniref:ABC transporter substrate-binding protein n=1 Tax=bacterium (Candidatus Blackallbacteria) CG17_big_fil_post_rev_8_21_14_2_50_48_46 TaxID=2014261 RepID=A0A2M7G6K9_9BACT|nr:MAG: ABC transporter substrate-binding protein [bacterium (Candidatus Blackallbacteria) CG18_big_fil_WC_8_21_14_2_50_49_26]PIW17664.1 MAG: ABC transporter substrate-binding protein [bacterium (Candidatus Blackallbacteria) CG17_big_fil_post_rev_8_21_14_2_50_48_46]PIW50117.1 MAG: ABC transporter substrate-binding protein [bacterium (Candidatus Blackallbacteria) CG13_big_fil_rev_8_21_14_2_50_49_14]